MPTPKLYAVLFELLGVFCHQMPERSWILLGVQFPLCIRCSALLLGGALAACYLFLRLPTPRARLAAWMSLPLVIDVVAQLVGLYQGNNWVRFATGLSFGFFALIGSLKWLAGRATTRGERASLLSPAKTA